MTRFEQIKEMPPEQFATYVDKLVGLGGPYTCDICKYSDTNDKTHCKAPVSSGTCKQGFIEYLNEEI